MSALVGRLALVSLLAVTVLASAAPAHAGEGAIKPIQIATKDQAQLLDSGLLKVYVHARRAPITVTVTGFVQDPDGNPIALTETVKVKLRDVHRKTIKLPLTPAGRAAADTCADPVVSARAVAGPTVREATKTLPSALRGCYGVGIASRSINPDADGTFAGQPVHLGGYGFGANEVTGERVATGILGDGLKVRAISISDGDSAMAVADIEVQGWFVATKDGPYGLMDMRKAVEQRTNGGLKASEVIVQSDHTHGGPDTIGVWGGVPVEYRAFILQQTVDAIVEAYESRRAGRLYYGVKDGEDLLSNQFDYDEANSVMDSDVRVLQARDAGETFATLLNFSAHTTVLGSSNTQVTGDWVQAANPELEARFGGEAVTMVGTLGRTQPADRACADTSIPAGEARDLCTIGDYAKRVVDRAEEAVAAAALIPGDAAVAATSFLITDTADNALILGANLAGEPIGAGINRAITPPWLTGNVLGTVTASARIGDVLLSSMPGEAYPQIPLKVRDLVPARGYMTAGLANDQLGYLIAPYEAYPEPIRRSFFNQRGDEVSPIDNDNYFFNVSPTMGERVTCSLLRGAGEVFGQGMTYRDAYERCVTFANDAALPPGADTDPLAGTE